jgi:serine/threonine protein kinase
MAPEAIYDPKRNSYMRFFAGKKYDVWSVGVSIYALIFNQLPYQPNTIGQGDVQQAILNFELDLCDEINNESSMGLPKGSSLLNSIQSNKRRPIREELRYFLHKMLEKDPKKRASFAELKKDVWINMKL